MVSHMYKRVVSIEIKKKKKLSLSKTLNVGIKSNESVMLTGLLTIFFFAFYAKRLHVMSYQVII